MGGAVTPPGLISKVEPEYTDFAREAKYHGTVVLYIEVVPDGTAKNIQVLTGSAFGLEERAVSAIRGWKFRPGTKDGQPVTVAANIEVNFRLK